MSLRVREKIASLTNPALRLVFAVEKNDVGAIARELRNGADPNFLTIEGATMLMAAVASGHGEAARALLEGGADPNRVSRFGNTVMDLAGNASDADSVVMLLEYGALPSEKLAGRQAQASGNSGEAEDAVRDFATALGDFVWETDAECKLTYLTGGVAGQGDPEKFLGRAPWELPGIDAEEATWTQFRDDISERQPLRAAAYRQEMADGEFRFFEINGAPQFGDDGALIRYRGIGRDITDWFARDEKLNSAWEAERKEYETLLTQQSEKLEKLERAPAGQAAAGASASAANLKKLLDERADEFQKEQAERKRIQGELAAHRDLVDELVGERTAELRLEVEKSQAENDKHKRSLGEMAARGDDLKSRLEDTTARLDTMTAKHETLRGVAKATAEQLEARAKEHAEALKAQAEERERAVNELAAERDRVQASLSETADALKKETGARQETETRLTESRSKAEAAAKAHANTMERETEQRAHVEKELSALTDRLAATETRHVEALRTEVTAREAVERDLKETQGSLEAALESKTQFLAAMSQQILDHLGAGGDGEDVREDLGEDAKVTPLRRGRGAK